MGNSRTADVSYLLPTGIFLLCTALIAATCYTTFENTYAKDRAEANKALVSIGHLKTDQIQSYLLERREDAAVISRFLMAPLAQYWLAHPGMNPPVILNQLAETIGGSYQYRGVLILDGEANVRLNTGRRSGRLTEAGKIVALRTMRERSAAVFRIYLGDGNSPEEPVLDTFVPVRTPDGKVVVGMIVLRSELKFLFELLQTWPVESETGESLLATRDGGDVLFLNDLRHKKGIAARFRIPLSADSNSSAWPAMFAASGHAGLLEANDYRGKRVLAYTLAVPGTSWGMVVKMDLDEAVANSRRLLRVAVSIAITLIALTGIAAYLWWRKEKADRLANAKLRESETRYRRLHESMIDAYVMMDMSGRILDSNQAYRDMLGYSADELQQLTCADLTPERWHELEARIIKQQVIPDGFSRIFEKECLRKDGTAFPAELKYFLLRDEDGKPEAMWAIVRDITERKKAEQRTRELTSHLQAVREDEKASIAREIHDDLGGTLTALKMETYWLADELARGSDADSLLKHVALMSQLAEDAVNVMRRVITGLRPTILDDLGLLAAIEWQAEQFYRHTGIACRVNSIGEHAKLDKQHSIALFRIFQETLTNVARHSGASKVEVEYHCSEDEVMLSVSDDGRGVPDSRAVSSTSFGMRGMSERAEQLGGKITFGSNPRGGLTVTATLPLNVDRRKELRDDPSPDHR